jgi:xanthine dehydrogenase accessory factor
MTQVWRRLLDAIDRRGGAALVTIAAIRGSAPREAGARMIINRDGTFSGTIGGGTLEWRAIALAQAACEANGRATRRQFALGPELGQCCGGQVELIIEVFGAGDRESVARLADLETEGPFATVAQFGDGGHLVRTVTDAAVPPGSVTFNDGRLTEGFGSRERDIMLFGAGHVGKALVLALAPLPFVVSWYDPRPDAFPAHLPQNATARQLGKPVDVVAAAPAGSFVLVMTHSHQLDLAVVHAALSDGRFPYVGLIGSKSKRARFEKRLAEGGIDRERIESLVCPIGVGEIRSKLPAAIAAATVAQLLERDERLVSGGEADSSAFRSLSSRIS